MPGNTETPVKRTKLLIVFAVVVLLVTFLILFGEILIQEGNPVPVICAVIKLELTGAEIVPVTQDQMKLMQKTGPEGPLTEYLAARGWVFKDRLGAGIFYARNGDDLFAEARMLTRRYVIFELDRSP